MKFPSFSEIFDILGRTLTRRSTQDAGKLRSTVIRKPLGWNKFDPFYSSFFWRRGFVSYVYDRNTFDGYSELCGSGAAEVR